MKNSTGPIVQCSEDTQDSASVSTLDSGSKKLKAKNSVSKMPRIVLRNQRWTLERL